MSDETDIQELSRQFTLRMYETVSALSKIGYTASRFHQMLIQENDGVAVARRLVIGGDSEGLERLQKMGRLDLSVEMWVLRSRYEQLFDQTTRDYAYAKLSAMGLDVDAEMRREESI